MEIPDAALSQLRHMPFEDLGFAKIDHHRALRCGMPEVILAKGKTPEQVAQIAARLLEQSRNMLATRANQRTADLVKAVGQEKTEVMGGWAIRCRCRTGRGAGRPFWWAPRSSDRATNLGGTS